MGQYLPIVVLLVLAVVFGALSFGASRLLAPRRPSSAKAGAVRVRHRAQPGATRSASRSRFYVVAMLFIMFDIEIIFIYPFAVDRAVPRRATRSGR